VWRAGSIKDINIDKMTEMTISRAPCIFACIYLLLAAVPVLACRFNVREVGFVDLATEPYHLYCFVDAASSGRIADKFQTATRQMLTETNIRAELVNVDQQKNHPALQHLDPSAAQALPKVVLVCPDGQRLDVPIEQSRQPVEQTIVDGIERILFSPVRQQILSKVVESYAVVLLIEGPQPEQNDHASQAVHKAMDRIKASLPWMPKPINCGPALVRLAQKDLKAEQVLLWVLGLKAGDVNEPCAAVFYGRGRWLGPVFKGPQITETELTNLMSVIGADCECGLDHRWLQGTMLPAKWDSALQAKTAKNLGFDPENPMIKAEVAGIVGRGFGGLPYAGGTYGYQEIVIDAGPTEPNVAVTQAVPVNEPNYSNERSQRQATDLPNVDMYLPLRTMAFVVLGALALVIVLSIAVLSRSRRT